ncbi:hypothetical protein [Streptomyces sp. MAR4 CNX-425]|uniref:hypothetical protein n=1 Tax=Streptomyces sp. MAR4 CNX-425 TaxID=3406343 RepID=UPI003B505691
MTTHAITSGTGFGLLTPADWYRIPLHPAAQRTASIKAMVDRQFTGVDNQPILRRKTEEELQGAAAAGAEQGGVTLYLSYLDAAGVPLSASLLVSLVPQHADPLRTATALTARGGATEVDLPAAGRATRRRRTERSRQTQKLGSTFADTIVEYFVPVPGRPELLLLTFSTPLEPLADEMTGLFDAVAGTLRWPRTATAGEAAG